MGIRVMPSARESYRIFYPDAVLTNRQIDRRVINDVRTADPNNLGIIVGMVTHQQAKEQRYI